MARNLKPAPSPSAQPTEVSIVSDGEFIDWPAVFAGAVIASAISWLLLTFGASIGLSVASPLNTSAPEAARIGVAAAIWFALTQIYAAGIGGYISGRMRASEPDATPDELTFRDGINGLTVWAVSVLVSLVIIGGALTSAANTGARLAGGALSGAGAAAPQALDYATDQLLRPQPSASSAAPAPDNTDLRPAREQIGRVLTNSLTRGEITPEDKTYLSQIIASRTGLSPVDAERRLNETFTKTRDAALQTADTARKATAFLGFWTAFVTLLAGIAAWWAATVGGNHRDRGTW